MLAELVLTGYLLVIDDIVFGEPFGIRFIINKICQRDLSDADDVAGRENHSTDWPAVDARAVCALKIAHLKSAILE